MQFIKEVELPETKKRSLRTATLEIRYCPVSINPPVRFKKSGNFNVYAVYATEINLPDGCEPVSWMLLTSELVSTQQEAEQILRWYTYRWKIEEYHKILKSGCKAESYRLAGEKQVINVRFFNSDCGTITANDLFTSEFSAQFGRISVNKNTNGCAIC